MALRKGSSLEDEAARRGGPAAASGRTGPPVGSNASGPRPPYHLGTTPAIPVTTTPNTNQQQGQASFLKTGALPTSGGNGSVGKGVNLAPRGQEMSANVTKVQSSYNIPSTTTASNIGSRSSGGYTYETLRASAQQYKDQAVFQRSQQQAHQLKHLLQREVQHEQPLGAHPISTAAFPVPSSSLSPATSVQFTSNGVPGTSGLHIPPQEHEPTLASLSWPSRGQKLQYLMSEVDNRFTLTPETSDLLLQMVESFVETVATQSVRAAKHRNSEVLEVKDIQLCLEKHWGMPWLGVGPMPATPSRASIPPKPDTTTLAAHSKQKPVRTKRKEMG